MGEPQYDVVVIGAGPSGENVADRAARADYRWRVIESELVGGECSYWACVPSKALLRPPAALAAARAVDGARQAVTGDLAAEAVLARRTRFTHGWVDDSSQVAWLDREGIVLIRGRGRLAGDRKVEVTDSDGDTVTVAARHAVVIATGSAAAIPPIRGLAEPLVWTSREATSAETVPGGSRSWAAASWLRDGHRVAGARGRGHGAGAESGLLPRLEPFVGEMVAASLRSAGVEVRTKTGTSRVRRLARATPVEIWTGDADTGSAADAGAGSATGAGAGQPADLIADELLVAAGRAPRTAGLGLESAGLESAGLEDGGWLRVDDTCLVEAVPGGWLYAVGDVNRRNLLTHMGKYQARACGDAIVARALGRAYRAASAMERTNRQRRSRRCAAGNFHRTRRWPPSG